MFLGRGLSNSHPSSFTRKPGGKSEWERVEDQEPARVRGGRLEQA